MPVLGFLSSRSPGYTLRVLSLLFVKGFGKLDLSTDKDFRIEFRWAEGQYDKVPSLTSELVKVPLALVLRRWSARFARGKSDRGGMSRVLTSQVATPPP